MKTPDPCLRMWLYVNRHPGCLKTMLFEEMVLKAIGGGVDKFIIVFTTHHVPATTVGERGGYSLDDMVVLSSFGESVEQD